MYGGLQKEKLLAVGGDVVLIVDKIHTDRSLKQHFRTPASIAVPADLTSTAVSLPSRAINVLSRFFQTMGPPLNVAVGIWFNFPRWLRGM